MKKRIGMPLNKNKDIDETKVRDTLKGETIDGGKKKNQ